MGYQKAVVKYLQTYHTLTPNIGYSNQPMTCGMDKGKQFFLSHNKMRSYWKRHDTVNLCYIVTGCPAMNVEICRNGKKWRPRKSRFAPCRLWLLWEIVVHSSLHINKINKYKNNCRNLCLTFASTKTGKVHEPGSINFSYAHTRSVN